MQTYIHAAWCFATSLLWPNNEHTDEEVREALSQLQQYFTTAPDKLEAFKTFCRKVIIAAKARKKCPILHPRLWLNPTCIQGLTALNSRANDLKAMKRKCPLFNELVSIIATHFLQYNQQPSAAIFLQCSEDLEALGLKDWMQTFYEATHHQPTA